MTFQNETSPSLSKIFSLQDVFLFAEVVNSKLLKMAIELQAKIPPFLLEIIENNYANSTRMHNHVKLTLYVCKLSWKMPCKQIDL